MDIKQRIAELEQEIRETPYHKGTEHHIGKLRARIAKLEDEMIERTSRRGGGGGNGYAVKKAGDATVVLVGPPSVGKSTLLNALTNAKSPVAPYSFTTVSVIPGMMRYHDASIQLLDVPGLIQGAASGKGRGKEVLSVVRGSDLIIFITEVGKEDAFGLMENELYSAGVRVNQISPNIRVEKKVSGGIFVKRGVGQTLSIQTIIDVAQEFGLRNAEITVKENVDMDRLIDGFAKNRVFIPALFAINKIDVQKDQYEDTNRKIIPVSAQEKVNLDKLRQTVWENLGFVRVYLYNTVKKRNEPVIAKQGQTLKDLMQKLGEHIAQRYTQAKISGPGSKFSGQTVSLTTRLVEGMVVTFI